MAQPGRRSDVDVERLQITLAKADLVQLDRIVRIGRFGRNRNEVAACIISDWLHDTSPTVLRDHLAYLDRGEEFDKRVPASEREAT